jgi:hypothetical protein
VSPGSCLSVLLDPSLSKPADGQLSPKTQEQAQELGYRATPPQSQGFLTAASETGVEDGVSNRRMVNVSQDH